MEEMQVLHEIIAAEREAREAVEKARRERADFDRSLAGLRRDMEARAEEKAREDIERARASVLKESEAALAQMQRQYEAEQAALESKFTAGRDVWAEQIFRMVVGLDDE